MLLQSDLWKKRANIETIARRAIAAGLAALARREVELAIVLTDDAAIRLLNRNWRGIDRATNVLSFPATGGDGNPPLLGDIVLAYETIACEARSARKPFAHHVAHLAVHGLLHLSGYDHERDEDADRMEELERDILQRLAIPDPYRRRAKAAKPRRLRPLTVTRP